MNKKSFFIGMLSGIVLTIAVLFIIGFVSQKNNEDDAIQRLEKPVSYENKKETSFKVFQVIGEDAALAKEISDKELDMYLGNTVVPLRSFSTKVSNRFSILMRLLFVYVKHRQALKT